PLEAVRDADHALGEQVDAPPQMREGEIDQLAFHLMPLGFLMSCLCLNHCSLDQAFDEGLHVTHGRCRAPVAEGALQIGAKPEAALCRRIGGNFSLGPSDQLAEPGLSSFGILGADRDVWCRWCRLLWRSVLRPLEESEKFRSSEPPLTPC